jgi:hypothetical protein
MINPIGLTLLTTVLAFASGTTTPKTGGARCATSILEGAIGKVDVERKTLPSWARIARSVSSVSEHRSSAFPGPPGNN